MPTDKMDTSKFTRIEAADLTNVAQLLEQAARQVPTHTAVAVATGGNSESGFSWDTITYQQLDDRASQIARGLLEMGIPQGTRLALLVRPGIEFIALVFGLMRAGMVQVLIDPGMGRSNMIRCLESTEPEGFVAIPAAHAVRCLLRRRFSKAIHNVTVGRRWFWGGKTYQQLLQLGNSNRAVPATRQSDAAAIIFTTGSTGPPKGVAYTHKMFIHQATQIRDYYDIQPGGADLSGFPLFALFNIGMGTTTIIPKMDPTRPADVHPPNIIEAVRHFKATQSFGSPALWNTVSQYCEKHQVQLPTLKRVFSAGAPVPIHVIKRVRKIIAEDGELYTPYGATEALPLASNAGAEVLNLSQDAELTAGTCVGHRFHGIRWRVIKISDEPIEQINQTDEVATGQIGELMVSGDVVSQSYINNESANQIHKVQDQEFVWHRMGDVGYLDDEDRFWFCGRKTHRVICGERTWFTIPTEAIFNQHAAIYRSALVGIGPKGQQAPVMIVQPWPDKFPATETERQELLQPLLKLATDFETGIQQVLIIKDMPVDIRHNSKIFREKLAVWAAQQLQSSSGQDHSETAS